MKILEQKTITPAIAIALLKKEKVTVTRQRSGARQHRSAADFTHFHSRR